MIIHKLIVHVLDKNSDVPILNDFEGEITQEVDGFFQKVIKRAAKDDDLRKGVFKEYHDNIIKNCCEQIIYNEGTFLDNSKEIASYLFEIMKVNSELESCDLAICLYTNKDEKNVAILKLDYKKLYTHSIEFVDDELNISFNSKTNGIVESQKPKQCAFVGASGLNDEYHLKVLDKISEKEGIETKFTTQFLNIEKIFDDKYMTKTFKKSADNWITNAITDVKAAESVRSGLNYTLKEKGNIDIKEFADTYLQDDKKESFIELMEEKEIESFYIDKDWVNKKVKKRKIKTDNGFSIDANITNFEDPMKYSIRKNENGTFDIVVKNVNFYEER
ncbi:nucleoid-associated protein [Clostridioides mangenotii]|uniref:nucleoid-associated protein n=1 Tax=Metaclostridioides mangenotii TaxID=1540 RepID=UPI002149BCE8|nr:nucleoid-associated protein [Clostridioides mangenotii]MCR1953813.1 nucleoid-associated protein [Clostridioides mangenotii]